MASKTIQTCIIESNEGISVVMSSPIVVSIVVSPSVIVVIVIFPLPVLLTPIIVGSLLSTCNPPCEQGLAMVMAVANWLCCPVIVVVAVVVAIFHS